MSLPPIPLPPVLDAPASSPTSAPDEPNGKRYVILHTCDVSSDDLSTFQGYGKVVQYEASVEGNIAIYNLLFDYLFIDLRVASARLYYDNSSLANYNVICYIHFVEKFDSYIESLGAQNILSELPPKQHFKSTFDSLLLQQNTASPSKCLSCINFGMSFLQSLRASGVRS